MLRVGRPFVRSLAFIVSLAPLACHAQNPVPVAGPPAIKAGVKLSPEMARRIEVLIRSRSQVPADYEMAIGEPTPSEVPGYVQVIVTFTANGNTSKPLPFLVSTDGKTLAQFNKFDLSQDPREKSPRPAVPRAADLQTRPVLIVGFDDLECPSALR